MKDILFDLAQLAVIIAVTLATKYLIPWIQKNARIADSEIVADIVDVAVRYVEQTQGKPGMGKTRKEIVKHYIADQLAEKKIHISDEEINAMIEAAVFAMNNEKPVKLIEADIGEE